MTLKNRYHLIKEGFDIVAAGGMKIRAVWDNDNSRLSWYVGSTEVARMDATTGLSSLGTLAAASFTGSITAHAGGGQGSATALTTSDNNVATCATNFDSVKLPTPVAGAAIVVRNSGAAILSVFPPTSCTINGLAVNLSIDVAVGATVTFRGISTTAYLTSTTLSLPAPSTQKGSLALKSADNSGNTQNIITNASQAAARTFTIPDPGASASFVMTEGAATINGIKTFGSMPRIPRASVVSAAGSVQGDAAALAEGFQTVSGANGTLGVVLPTAVAGAIVWIKGVTNGVLKVWPASGAAINGLGSNNAMSLASGLVPAIFIADSTTQWYTFPLLPS